MKILFIRGKYYKKISARTCKGCSFNGNKTACKSAPSCMNSQRQGNEMFNFVEVR